MSNLSSIDNLELIISVFIIFVAIVIMFVYMQNKNNVEQRNCDFISKESPGDLTFYSFKELLDFNYFKSGTTNNYTCRLKDFYIKSSYNSFCNGTFKNEYVNVCALTNCANQGVRFLDMQIYSLDGVPIVSCSSSNSNYEKNSYNYIDLKTAIQNIYEGFLTPQGGISDQSDDPLFLNFRIFYSESHKTSFSNQDINIKKKIFYHKVYSAIMSGLGNEDTIIDTDNMRLFSLYQRKFNPNYDNEREYIVTNLPFDQCYKKVFIFVNLNHEHSSDVVKDTSLNDIVDLYTNDYGMSAVRSDEIADDTIVSYRSLTRQKMVMCMPPLQVSSDNYDFVNAFSNGIQFVSLSFQNKDSYLDNYNSFFQTQIGSSSQTKSSPYIKKPDHMIDTSVGDPPLFMDGGKYSIKSNDGVCQDLADGTSNVIECLNDSDTEENNYQVFKFEKMPGDDVYAIKTYINDKYCELSDNNLICDSDVITENGQFAFNKTSKGKYRMQGIVDLSYCEADDGNINCNSSVRTANSKFSIVKRIV